MKCSEKKVFITAEEANLRAGEINSEICKKNKKREKRHRKPLLRPYKCECGNYHLSKMKKGYLKPPHKRKVNLYKERNYWLNKLT